MQRDIMAHIERLDLRQKIGQLMMVGFPGKWLNEEIKSLIRDDFVGGVILFSRNIGAVDEVKRLTHELQTIASQSGHPFPLFLSIDQENGMVRRLEESVIPLPGNMTLGAVNDIRVTEEVAYHTGRVLARLGINMNLAPVVDVNHNPYNPVIGIRSFGSSPEHVARHGRAMIGGLRRAGLMAVAKHFPGHGDTHTDSHLDLPVIHADLKRLMQLELVPFQQAVQAGVDAVMTAHIAFPHLTEGRRIPATISPEILSLLREDLGYRGVIISDCLEMNAIRQTVGTVEGAVQALKAGVDVILISHTYTLQKAAIDRIVQAVRSGELDEKRIHESLMRIFTLKLKLRQTSSTSVTDVADTVPKAAIQNTAMDMFDNMQTDAIDATSMAVTDASEQEEMIQLAARVYQRAVTVVKDERQFIPLRISESKTVLLIYPRPYDQSPVEDQSNRLTSWIDWIKQLHARVVAVEYDAKSGDILNMHETIGAFGGLIGGMSAIDWPSMLSHFFSESGGASESVGAVLVGTLNAHRHPDQVQMVHDLYRSWEATLSKDVPFVVTALRGPYDGLSLPDVPTFVVAYETSQGALCALTQVLFGKIPATGQLPVTLP